MSGLDPNIIMCRTCRTTPCICERPETLTSKLGAKRDKENIPDFRLIPYVALYRLAQRYSHGAIKYSERNWENGKGDTAYANDCLNRAINHIMKYAQGDRSEDHLAAAAWNIFALMFFEAP